VIGAAALSLITAAATNPASAQEKLVGTYGEARIILGYKVSDAALQKIVPEGWESSPVATGPATGANLMVTFVDQLAVQDPDGKPTATIRIAAVNFPAKKKGTDATVAMVYAGFSSDSSYVPGAYGTFGLAKAAVYRDTRTDPTGKSTSEESWEFRADNGEFIRLQVQYDRGIAPLGKSEAKVHSAIRPDFYRIYRIQSATDAVRSTSTGTDHVKKFVFEASGQKLAPLFDGSQQLVSIISLPWYWRQVFLPDQRTQ